MNAGQLHRLARLLREVASAATADPGEVPLAGGHTAIVEDVAYHDGTSVGDIARRTGLAQSLVSKTVAAMRDAGVLVTAGDPADGRRVLVSVSPATRARVFRSRAVRPIEPAIRARRPDVSETDLRRLGELLDELAERLLRPPNPP